MDSLLKFIPDNFNQLTKEEKKDAIIELANEILKKLKLDPIPVYFDSLQGDNTKSGVFLKYPTCIYLNDFFINDEMAKETFTDLIDPKRFLPYYLVHTIAHECYHYHQYCLINKLVNGENLNNAEIDEAYIQFISLYGKTFRSFCKEKGILPQTTLDNEILYNYCPSELSADNFATYVVSKLKSEDENFDNYEYYSKIMDAVFIFTRKNSGNFECDEARVEVIKYNLEVALTFLKHKNNGLKAKYLNIDEEKLNNSVMMTIHKIEEEMSSFSKLLKNIKKINNK